MSELDQKQAGTETASRKQRVVIPRSAVGVAMYRFEPDRQYTPIEFERGYLGCERFCRILHFLGMTESDPLKAAGVLDVLDGEQDTVESVFLTSKGMKQCYQKLDMRVQV